MHLIFLPRGVQHQIDIWKTMAQCQFWKWKRKNLNVCECGQPREKHKKTKTCKRFKMRTEFNFIQGALKPSVFGCWEYVFPEECLTEVLAVFGCPENYKPCFKIKALRQLFRAEKIPKKNIDEAQKVPPTIMVQGSNRGLANCRIDGVGMYFIGLIRDRRVKWKDVGYEQELL